MAYGSEVIHVAQDAPGWQRILYGAVNWLDSMKIGMTFGVMFGALLHTHLRYYPIKIGNNLYLNSLKGALVGIPMGVCANCAVPTACGVTRGHGRVEVALGFLFSSPNFNPVVMFMTFTALPLAMGLVKYAVLLTTILFVVPLLISWLERTEPLKPFAIGTEGESCVITPQSGNECTDTFGHVFHELTLDFGKNIWMLAKPTFTIMLLASLASSAILTLVPFNDLLAQVTPLHLAIVAFIAVLMPVPIALDVMFAAMLFRHGVAANYVMLFAMTLGTYSIIPSIYLWREVSKKLAVSLFVYFMLVGWLTGMAFN
jgi:uncharacterized membrane protein YraQ (UPF0718 family)